MNVRNNSTGIGGPLAVVGAAVAMIVCCAGPALIAAGALTALGGALLGTDRGRRGDGPRRRRLHRAPS
jgi:hypothetical protein